MNILIINHYAGSPTLGMEFRPYYLAKEWIRLGHKVNIIAANYSHLRLNQPIISSNFENENIDNIEYFWIRTISYKSSKIKRVCNILLFIAKLLFYCRRILFLINPDVVIASSTYPLDIFPATRIAKRNKAKLIFEVHDLWPLSPIQIGGYSKYHPFIWIMQLAENYAYRHCDKVVSILPYAKDHMIKHGLENNKFTYIPNGIALGDWERSKQLPMEHQSKITGFKTKGKFLISYAGAHGPANSLYSLIDEVAKLNNNNIQLILVGSGVEKNNLITYVKRHKFENICFLDPIEKLAIPTFLRQMDVLFLGLANVPLYQYGISPNKLFDYMMAAKPIILSVGFDYNLVNDIGCGYTVNSNDKISEAILKLQAMGQEDRDKLGYKGFNYVSQNHSFTRLAKSFIDIIVK